MTLRRMGMAMALAATMVWVATAQTVGQNDKEFQAALQKEMVAGNVKGAIEDYERIAARRGVDRALAAEALLRMAGCYVKLGDLQASQVYERILRDYSDQPKTAAIARAQLGPRAQVGSGARLARRQLWTGSTIDGLGSVSPDGKYVSFTDWRAGGDLALHDLATGTDRPLTKRGTGQESGDFSEESAISRDGTRVAYSWFVLAARRYELRLLPVGGSGLPTPRTVYANPDVDWIAPFDWSPDGRWLAVALTRQDRTGQIGLVNVADGKLNVLKSVDWRGATEMAFSPDGAFLAYDLPASDTSIQRDVHVMDLRTLRETTAVSHAAFDALVGWSPDGTSLLFRSDRAGPLGLWSVPVARGATTGEPELIDGNLGHNWLGMSITTSGALVYYTRSSTSGRNVYLASVDFETGKVLSAPRPAVESYFFDHSRPDWSPDGKFLVYASEQGRQTRGLSILALDTGAVSELRVPMTYVIRPQWTPDGAIAVEGTDLKGRAGLFRIDPRTGDASPIFLFPPLAEREGPQLQFAWSLDGRQVVFRRGGAIVSRDLGSGQERVVRQVTTAVRGLSLSPDNRQIAFVEFDDKASTLYVMAADGTNVRALYRPAQPATVGNLTRWTPDGQRIVFVTNDRTTDQLTRKLWSIPSTGGQPVTIELDAVKLAPPSLRIHPDGRRVAFDNPGTRLGEVWILENFLPASR